MKFFIINNHQLDQLDRLQEQRFIEESILYLESTYKKWFKKNTHQCPKKLIKEIQVFAKRFHITNEDILFELMRLEIEFGVMNILIPKAYKKVLCTRTIDEYVKIDMIKKSLINKIKK